MKRLFIRVHSWNYINNNINVPTWKIYYIKQTIILYWLMKTRKVAWTVGLSMITSFGSNVHCSTCVAATEQGRWNTKMAEDTVGPPSICGDCRICNAGTGQSLRRYDCSRTWVLYNHTSGAFCRVLFNIFVLVLGSWVVVWF